LRQPQTIFYLCTAKHGRSSYFRRSLACHPKVSQVPTDQGNGPCRPKHAETFFTSGAFRSYAAYQADRAFPLIFAAWAPTSSMNSNPPLKWFCKARTQNSLVKRRRQSIPSFEEGRMAAYLFHKLSERDFDGFFRYYCRPLSYSKSSISSKTTKYQKTASRRAVL
jgi:hypothetical protein